MNFKDLIDVVNKDRRKKERIKAAQTLGVGMSVVAAVGVATGIVLAPKSGKETREDIKNKIAVPIETIKESVMKNVDTIKDNAANVVQEVRNENI